MKASQSRGSLGWLLVIHFEFVSYTGGNLLRVVGCEGLGLVIVRIPVCGQGGIPSRAFVCVVFDDTFGEVEVGDAICVVSRGGIVRVRTIGAVHYGLSGRQHGVPATMIPVVPTYP